MFIGRHHILQFGPAIQAGNEHLVHHMEVFHCVGLANLEVPMYDGPCDGVDRPEKTQVQIHFSIKSKCLLLISPLLNIPFQKFSVRK